MVIDENTGLVLEGGGMRGVFTAGVLDYMMDNQIWFPYTIGVSAGASNGISYISRQRGRSYFSNVELPTKRDYIGLKHMLKGHGYIDLDFIFYEYPDKYFPFDFETYKNNKMRFVIVTSNCITGTANYYEEKEDFSRLVEICKASCSLPVMCPITYVDNIPMVDGGVCDPIPIKKAISDGYSKNVIVLTRNKGYRKEEKDFYLPWFIYKRYPQIRERLKKRYYHYNEILDFIDALEEEGKVIVIRPETPLKVGRTEKNVSKMKDLYYEGYNLAEKYLSKSNF